MPLTWLVALWVAAQPPLDDGLTEPRRQVEAGRYQDAMPHLRSALEEPLTAPQRLQALELLAVCHAAFGQFPAAVEHFRLVLGIDQAHRPAALWGPKVLALFEQALALGPLGGEASSGAVPPPAPPPLAAASPASTTHPVVVAKAPPLLERWWFWATIGLALAGVGGVVGGVALTRRGPTGNLGSAELP